MKATKKDLRIVYNYKAIQINGTNVFFDGKGNQEEKSLKIYRRYGDINLMDEAIQNFCIDNNYNTVIILY